MTLLRWLALAAAVTGAGCSFLNPPHALNPEGEQVTLVERRIELLGCVPLSTVQGHASSIFRFDIQADIESDARNKAGHHGGNRIIVKPSHELLRNSDLAGTIYEVFHCPPPAQAALSAQTARPAAPPAAGDAGAPGSAPSPGAVR
jgi:hypothetical protein